MALTKKGPSQNSGEKKKTAKEFSEKTKSQQAQNEYMKMMIEWNVYRFVTPHPIYSRK